MRKGGEARHSFSERVLGAFGLREEIFAEIIADRAANQQAIRALLLGSLGPAIGAAFAFGTVVALPFYFIGALIAWPAYGALAYLLGTRLFDASTTRRNMDGFARAIAFAGLPRFVMAGAVSTILSYVLGPIAVVWCLVATVIAMRSALSLSIGRALGAAVTAFVTLAVLASLVLNIAAGLT